jgi:hypothetical protein
VFRMAQDDSAATHGRDGDAPMPSKRRAGHDSREAGPRRLAGQDAPEPSGPAGGPRFHVAADGRPPRSAEAA